MNAQILFYCILGILLIEFLIDTILDVLNARKFKETPPEPLENLYDESAYEKSQAYKTENYRFGLLSSTFSLLLILSFLIFGGFEWVDNWVRSFTDSPGLQALFFFGIIFLGSDLFSTPFAYYQTFVIEEKYGFNTSSKALFIKDKLKGWLLLSIIGGGLLLAILWFYSWAGPQFWLYAWGVIALFTLFMNLFYSRLIVPLFNRQTPLDSGSLRSKIQDYAQQVGFELKNIFVVDGSKRSTKANAYFSGFGKEKRITLYDTLIQDLEEDEIVAVLAHEVGHYKKHHILINLVVSILLTGLTLFLLSLFVNQPEMALAIGVSQPSFHAALIAFALLYSPISEITSLMMNVLSRKFEFQADAFARKTFNAAPLVSALKKLHKKNLSNLTPHSAYVFMHYSHPPLIERIRALMVRS